MEHMMQTGERERILRRIRSLESCLLGIEPLLAKLLKRLEDDELLGGSIQDQIRGVLRSPRNATTPRHRLKNGFHPDAVSLTLRRLVDGTHEARIGGSS